MSKIRVPATRKTSILDVARKAGVSLGTASRVINQHPSVSQDKRVRVLQAIDELAYVPDKVAQAMRSHRSMTFACVMRDFMVPVLSMFVDAMQREVDAYGFSLMVASSHHDAKRELSLLQGFEQRRIDGLVIASYVRNRCGPAGGHEGREFPHRADRPRCARPSGPCHDQPCARRQ